LSNAVKFSHERSEVLVDIESSESTVRILVKDQGIGVPESFRSRIFQKFAQADGSVTRGQGGTGLGLAITREIMTKMGGSVGFNSAERQGSTFWLELPLT